MILYLSGNFPQLVSPGKEKIFRDNLHGKSKPYHRLVTFYYIKHCQTVLDILKEEKENP